VITSNFHESPLPPSDPPDPVCHDRSLEGFKHVLDRPFSPINPITKMNKLQSFILSVFSIGFLSSCAHQQVAPYVPPIASSTDIDNGLKAVSAGTQNASADVARAQDTAAKLYSAVTNATTNQVIWQEVVDLRSDLADSQSQLTNVVSGLNVTTGKLLWYETNYTNTYSTLTNTVLQLQTAITDKNKALAGEAWWRSKALWEAGILLLIALGVAIYFGGPWLAKIAGTAVKA